MDERLRAGDGSLRGRDEDRTWPRLDPVTGLVTPPPVQINARRIVAVATALWFVAFLALLPFWSWLGRHDHRLWLWTCLAGGVLGIAGWSIMTRHARIGRTV